MHGQQPPYPPQYPPYGQPPAAPQPAPRRRRKWPWIVGAAVVLFVVGIANGGGQTPTAPAAPATRPATAAAPAVPTAPATPAAAVAPAAPAGPGTTVSDGTYEVGVDIEPGRYKTSGPDQSSVIPNCYWQRAKDDSGEFRSIIANENLQGPGSVTVKDGEFVNFTGGCTWTKS